MRGLLLLGAGGLGVRAFWRRLRRRSELPALGPDPAAELRAKLAESKEVIVATPEPPEAAATALDPSARRGAIHDRARGAMDELA
jgi:hypothetical protein